MTYVHLIPFCIVSHQKKEVRSCAIQASYIDFAPGTMVFSVCDNNRLTKLHTCGTENVIPMVTLIFIVLKGVA